MFAPTLALLTRSFRVDARSHRAHLIRFTFVILILLTVVFTHLVSGFYGAPGLSLLTAIAWLNFVLIMLSGIGFFSTAISEEKDEGTLGLLKMAGAGPAALLLGKSSTRLVSVLLVLGIQFPFVLLATTLGGVTSHQVVALFVALAAFMVFMANLGLLCSVVGSNSRRSARMMSLLIVGYSLIITTFLDLLKYLLQTTGSFYLLWLAEIVDAIEAWGIEISAVHHISEILSTGFAESPFSWQVIADLAGGVLLFLLSWLLFERFTRESHAMKPLEQILVEPMRRKRRTTKNRVWKHALVWKDFHFVAGGRLLVIVRIVVYLILVGVIGSLAEMQFLPVGSPREVFSKSTMLTMLAIGVVELSLFSARVFQAEVQAQTLPLLMMLPESTPRIALSKVAAVLPALAPTIGYFLLGLVVYPEGLLEYIGYLFSMQAWYSLCGVIFFCSLTAYLSLIVNWGALPLAVFLIYMSQCCISPMYLIVGSMMQPQHSMDVITFLTLLIPMGVMIVLSVILQIGICKKIEALAAQ